MRKKLAKVLVIAGSDSGGGAGIQADIKSIAAQGAYASTVITSVTAQNTLGVQAISDVPLDIIRAQIESVMDDIGANFIKVGMLSSKEIIDLVARAVNKYQVDMVLDPVMVAKGGAKLLRDDAVEELKTKLIPKAYLITPNIPEAEVISGMKINNEADMEAAAKKIIADYSCKAVLLKGGHLPGKILTDILVKCHPECSEAKSKDIEKDPSRSLSLRRQGLEMTVYKFRSKKIDTLNTHGTGCTYASAITARLAMGESLQVTVKRSHKYLRQAIKNSESIGGGHSPVNHFWFISRSGSSDIIKTALQITFSLLALAGLIIPTIKYLTQN